MSSIFSDRLNAEQAAAILGVSVGTLAIWRTTKRYPLPYVKIGYRVFYRGKDVEAFINSRTYGPIINKTSKGENYDAI